MQNHPLFPPLNDDEDPPEVEQIHVTRFEAAGNQPWCAYRFGAEELTDLQQVFDLFGGGKYELVARADNRISARRRYELAGKSRPLVIGTTGEETEPAKVTAPVPPVQAPPESAAGLLGVVMQMMQMQQSSNQLMMQAMMKSSENTMTAMTSMTTAMLSRDSDGNKAMMQALQANNERALQGQAQVFSTMLEAISKASGGGQDVLKVYKEGLADAAGDDSDTESDGGIMGTMKTAVEGMKVLSTLTGDGPPAAPAEELVQ